MHPFIGSILGAAIVTVAFSYFAAVNIYLDAPVEGLASTLWKNFGLLFVAGWTAPVLIWRIGMRLGHPSALRWSGLGYDIWGAVAVIGLAAVVGNLASLRLPWPAAILGLFVIWVASIRLPAFARRLSGQASSPLALDDAGSSAVD